MGGARVFEGADYEVIMSNYYSKESLRIEMMTERFLAPMLSPDMDILSVGCGAGSDVITLRRMGFKAYGLDPSRLSLDIIPDEHKPFLQACSIEDYSARETKKFDFIYALDVIEHVGCVDFGTLMADDADAQRSKFLAACFSSLKSGGTLLLTTSNRLFPIDLGHWHKYHWLGQLFPNREKLGVSPAWHKKNFLLSQSQVRALLEDAIGRNKFRVETVKTALYPTLVGRKSLLRPFLRIVDLPLLIGSPVAPLLVLKVTKLGD